MLFSDESNAVRAKLEAQGFRCLKTTNLPLMARRGERGCVEEWIRDREAGDRIETVSVTHYSADSGKPPKVAGPDGHRLRASE